MPNVGSKVKRSANGKVADASDVALSSTEIPYDNVKRGLEWLRSQSRRGGGYPVIYIDGNTTIDDSHLFYDHSVDTSSGEIVYDLTSYYYNQETNRNESIASGSTFRCTKSSFDFNSISFEGDNLPNSIAEEAQEYLSIPGSAVQWWHEGDGLWKVQPLNKRALMSTFAMLTVNGGAVEIEFEFNGEYSEPLLVWIEGENPQVLNYQNNTFTRQVNGEKRIRIFGMSSNSTSSCRLSLTKCPKVYNFSGLNTRDLIFGPDNENTYLEKLELQESLLPNNLVELEIYEDWVSISALNLPEDLEVFHSSIESLEGSVSNLPTSDIWEMIIENSSLMGSVGDISPNSRLSVMYLINCQNISGSLSDSYWPCLYDIDFTNTNIVEDFSRAPGLI